MYIMDDNIRLNAKLDRPVEGKCPLAIVIHGFTGHMEERHILAVCAAMHEIGFATLRVDMYGHGDSDGQFHDHTLFKWLTNALAVIDYAAGLDFATDLYLCGHSQGGLAVMFAAAMHRDRIKGVVALAPALTIPGWAREGRVHGIRFDPARVPEEFEVGEPEPLGGNYVRAAQLVHPEDSLLYEGPILFVHGLEDPMVPFRNAPALYESCAGEKDCLFVPGARHVESMHVAPEAYAEKLDAIIKKTVNSEQ